MAQVSLDPMSLLSRAVENDRVHGAYLLSGDARAAAEAAVTFARALVCTGEGKRPCDRCHDCELSSPLSKDTEPTVIRGKEKSGPFFRHIGGHPDLRWLERGPADARVTIGQIRAMQAKLRLSSSEGGRKVAVISDAESMQREQQNALLRILEEPPPGATLIILIPSAVQLLATIRSRCVRAHFPRPLLETIRGDNAPQEIAALTARLDQLTAIATTDLLNWAEEFRGERAVMAAAVEVLLTTSSEWLREKTVGASRAGQQHLHGPLEAFRTLQRCRSDLVTRNANPQMVAERALMTLQAATGGRQ